MLLHQTYPSLLSLYAGGLLPKEFQIRGYARSAKTSEEFRSGLRPWLEKTAKEKGLDPNTLQGFLEKCFYTNGPTYDDLPAFERLNEEIEEFEAQASIAAPPIIFNLSLDGDSEGEDVGKREVRGSEERNDELTTPSLETKITCARTSVQDAPLPYPPE